MKGEMKLRDAFSDLNPFVNFIFYVAVIGISASVLHPWILIVSFCGGFLVTVCRKGIKQAVLRSLKILPLAVFTAIMNPLFSHEGATILTYLPSGNPLTMESLLYGAAAGMMMMNTLIWFLNMSEMMTGEKWIYLFGKTIPSLSLVLSMVFRFVPKLLRQIKQTYALLSQSESETGGIRAKILLSLHTFSAVVSWALEDAAETADSMRSRGYGILRRTTYSRYGFDGRDGSILIMILCFSIISIIKRPQWGYFPVFYTEASKVGVSAFLMLCMLPAGLGIFTDIRYGLRIRRLSE